MSKKLFLDVSHHNGAISIAEFKQMKKDGICAINVKLSEGQTFTDPLAQSYIKNANAAGLIVNAYHFFRANSQDEANREAEIFVGLVKKYGIPTSHRLACDVEVSLGGNMTEDVQTFLNRVRALGYTNVDWYSYQPFIDAHLRESELPKKLWKAKYPAHYDVAKPPFSNVGAWQYSNHLHLKGVSGYYDCSIDYTGAYTVKRVAKKKKVVKKLVKPMTLVEYMNSKKLDASYKNRVKLAKAYGIKGYVGSVSQNVKLLAFLKSNKKPTPKVKKSKYTKYVITAALLNVRKKPNGKIVVVLKHGQTVEVTSIKNGWAKIKSGKSTLYVGSKFIKKV
jgi:GH25 family lysozyme M1 (1,4-beta-N-acetylmuramidase)